jgi:starch-binding outer membrane protein, SusD/RagB family
MRRQFLTSILLISAIVFASTGCKKILEEQPRTGFAPTFFTTSDGIQGGIAGIYSSFRGHWGTQIFTQLFNAGTDESLKGGAADVQHWFTYNNPVIKSSTNDYAGLYNSLFIDINTANGVLEYGVNANIPAATKTQLLAQAKFLRGFCYYYLVTTFGQVPLHITFNTSPSAADAPAPLADLYAQMIKDFTESAADLPNTPAAGLGKPAYKATALFLLAKTYLWRGWSTVAQPTDFTQAYTISKGIIDNKATYGLNLLPYFGNVFREGQEYSSEVLMVIDHTKDLKFGQNNQVGAGGGGAGANHSNFFWRPNYPTINANYPASGGSSVTVRDINNGRPFQRIRPNTKYIMDVAFANRATDARYEGTFQTAWLSNSSQMSVRGSTGATTPRGTLINGVDTAIWMADRLVTPAERAAFKGIIFEPDHLPGATVRYTASYYPSVRKFDDSTRGDLNDYSDRPYILFRFSEVYLVAAEAALKGGATTQDAADMINVLRTRAALKQNQTPAQYTAAVAAQQITAAQVTVDFLLEERSRELFAEDVRWWDLSRTKKLVERVNLHNTEQVAPGVQPYNMLRPIPQQQIDLVTEGPPFPQNPGYQ